MDIVGRDRHRGGRGVAVRAPDSTLLMLPGMAVDERSLRPQRRAFPDLIVPAWIDPQSGETLPEYAARLARGLDGAKPALVGGVSFGGFVALELAAHLGVPTCVLIASVRSPSEMPRRFRALRPLARLGPAGLGAAAGWASRWGGSSLRPGTARRLGRLAAPDAAFLRWACWAALDWEPSPAARSVRVRQIHGSDDRTFPLKYTAPDEVVAGAGHLLSQSHAAEVNAFLRRALADAARGGPAARDDSAGVS